MNYHNNLKQSLLTLVVSAVGAMPRSPILATAPLPCCLHTGLLPSLSSQKIGLFSVSLPSPNSGLGLRNTSLSPHAGVIHAPELTWDQAEDIHS